MDILKTKLLNRNQFLIKSICTMIIAAMIVTLFPGAVLAGSKRGSDNGGNIISEKTIKTLALKYLNGRNRYLVSSKPEKNRLLNVSTIKKSEMSTALAKRQENDIAKIRALTKTLEDQGLFYWNRFKTEVEIIETKIDGDKTIAHVSEYTRCYFTPGKGKKGEYSSFAICRNFTFAQNGSRWIISDAQITEPKTMAPPNEPSYEPSQDEISPPLPPEDIELFSKISVQALSSNDSSKPKDQINTGLNVTTPESGITSFNQQAIIDYCNMYNENYTSVGHAWNCTCKYNSQWYPVYKGNDCQNFASQALHYAGWGYVGYPTNNVSSWYCVNKNASYTFRLCDWFLSHVARTGRGFFNADYNNLRVGDLVLIDVHNDGYPTHTMVVYRAAAGNYQNVRVDYHSANRHNWPLVNVLNQIPNSTHTYWLCKTF